MARQFNLIATTLRGEEAVGAASLSALLAELGDSEARVETTRVQGVLTASTRIDPFMVVERLRGVTARDPLKAAGLMRVIPVEEVAPSRVEEIAGAVERLKGKIPPDATYKVVVEKRHTQLSSREIIEAVAARVDRRVSLRNPDWIILVEIIGGVAGVSVLTEGQILSLAKAQGPGARG